MTGDLFDMRMRALRRDRAARCGPELFLSERAFAECLDRLSVVQRRFRSALLLGCPDPGWVGRLSDIVPQVDVMDPGPAFATAAGGSQVVEDLWEPEPGQHDLCLAVGTLDSVNDLPRALLAIRFSLASDGLVLGALSGGETLPRLRAAMRAADTVTAVAAPHVHPRIAPSALAGLLTSAGFRMPVVDVDRVPVSYPSLARLVGDLRAMGATNVLNQRPRDPLSRAALAAAAAAFADNPTIPTVETFEIIHFAAWTPAD